MRPLIVTVPALALAASALLAGCGDNSSPTSSPPTTTGFSSADAIRTSTSLPPLLAADLAFLGRLDAAGVPHPSDRSAIADARIVCANLASGTGTRDDVAGLVGHELAFVNAAADTYCPEITPPAPAPPPGPADNFYSGTHVVGVDIEPGTYRTTGPVGDGLCYWARLKDTSGDFEAIITNGLPEGPATVTIKASDGAFETSGCGQWTKTG